MYRDIYFLPVQIHVMHLESGVEGMNLPVTNNDFKIVKGANSPVEFVLRDQSRKPINIIGKSLEIIIMEPYSETIRLRKKLKIMDPYAGRVRLPLKPYEFASWDIGIYNWTILLIDENGDQFVTYTDRNQSAKGTLEIVDGILPKLDSSQVVDSWIKLQRDRLDDDEDVWVSEKAVGNVQNSLGRGLITLQVYPKNYTGKFYVEGTLEAQPYSTDQLWFRVPLEGSGDYHYFQNCNSPSGFNIIGIYSYLRFVFQRAMPGEVGTNDTPEERRNYFEDNRIEKVLVKVR